MFKNRPELEINIFGQTFSALLDSGASCSAKSEATFTILQQNHGTREKLIRLLVHGVTVSTPIVLGDDWLSRYNVVLDYQLDLVRFPSGIWNIFFVEFQNPY